MRGKNIKILSVMIVLIAMLTKAEVCLSAPHDFFFVVHCEALDPPLIDMSLKKGLRPLVRMADAYGIKLTISISPQWAGYFMKDPSILREVGNWLHNGHEIGILHYGLHHKPTWDYYTNETDPRQIIKAGRDPRKKKGSMTDLVHEVNRVLLSEIVKSEPAQQLSIGALDYEKDVFPGIPIRFITDGYRISSDPMQQDVIKKPERVSLNGAYYWRLSMGYFSTVQPAGATGGPGGGQVTHSLSTVYNFLRNSFKGKDMPEGQCDLSCFRLSVRYFTTLRPSDCGKSRLLGNLFSLFDSLKGSPVMKDDREYTFGLATHPLDFIADNPVNGGCGNFEKLFAFISVQIKNRQITARTVSRILSGRFQETMRQAFLKRGHYGS